MGKPRNRDALPAGAVRVPQERERREQNKRGASLELRRYIRK